MVSLLLVRCLTSGSPGNRTQRDPVISRIWATSPRLPFCVSSSREGGTRTHDLMFPKHAGWPLPYIPMVLYLVSLKPTPNISWGDSARVHRTHTKKSERPDLNRRSPGPRPGAIPGFATFCRKWLVWESNPSLRLERAISSTDRRTSRVCAYTQRKWAGRRSNPRLLVFSQALYRLSYQPNEKRPGVACDTGP